MAKKPRVHGCCASNEPRARREGGGEEDGNEGEGETRLIKRRPPPSANGPTAQELHAGNCCANTTTFILQPLGKRHILFNQERCCALYPPPSSFFDLLSLFLGSKESKISIWIRVFGTRVDPNNLAIEFLVDYE